MSEEVNLKCTTCIYFHREGTQIHPIIGTCRRYPPPNHRANTSAYYDLFPKVSSQVWCAEHQDFKLEAAEVILPRLRKIRGE